MSTKTTFKRVALVAVAALGLGALSVAPSQATVIGTTITSVNGTATTATSDSSTAGSLRVTYTATASTDSVTISSYVSARPTGATTIAQSGIVTHLLDTSTSTVLPVLTNAAIGATSAVRGDSVTVIANGSGNPTGQVSANFAYYLLSAPATAGTYTITAVVTPFSNGTAGTAVIKTLDIVVSAAAKATQAYTQLGLGTNQPVAALGAVDSVVAASKTASNSVIVGKLAVSMRGATGTEIADNFTATITGAGTLGQAAPGTSASGTAVGRSITITHGNLVHIFADGTGGVGTVTISTAAGAVVATKTVSFYGDPAVITLTANSVVGVGVTGTSGKTSTVTAPLTATVFDSAGYVVTGAQVYVTSSDTTVISNSYTAASDTTGSTGLVHLPITGVKAGTAKVTVGLASSATDVTTTGYAIKSDAVTLTVAGGKSEQAGVIVGMDKQTYVPGSYAWVTVTPVDKAGKVLAADTYTVFSSTGISANMPFDIVTTGINAATVTTRLGDQSSSTVTVADPVRELSSTKFYKIKLPMTQGDFVLSWTTAAASNFPGNIAAGGVAGSLTVTISDPGSQAAVDAAAEATDAANAATDAALAAADAADAATAAAEDASAAVATLSKSVTTALNNLKKQITSLTALVNKLLKR